MRQASSFSSNFTQLQQHDEQLLRIGLLAEHYFTKDPNTRLLKLRQLAEALARTTASCVGLSLQPDESRYDRLRRLRD